MMLKFLFITRLAETGKGGSVQGKSAPNKKKTSSGTFIKEL